MTYKINEIKITPLMDKFSKFVDFIGDQIIIMQS